MCDVLLPVGLTLRLYGEPARARQSEAKESPKATLADQPAGVGLAEGLGLAEALSL
jgi:hypothetical protein